MANPMLCCVCQDLLNEEDMEHICITCFRKANIEGSSKELVMLRDRAAILLRGMAKLQFWSAGVLNAAATRLELEGGPIPPPDAEPHKTIMDITKELKALDS